MSPSSKSKTKSKDKAAKAAKEQKVSTKSSGSSTNTSSSTPASAYNPISGTFHTLEILSAASSPHFQDNGRFRNIDDPDEHSSSPHGNLSEYDSVSNNGSCSGESEDPKDKTTNPTRQETVPGLDNERREKIRLKNEKKHQRQKERRAQELHERCSGYLMSRKLEALSEQLVAMGFSQERATLALVLNEGRLEESVNWLFEGNEEEARNKDSKHGSSANLKIDISEELAQISVLELRYKCSKQEVERAIVISEGDLHRAEEFLQAQKRDLLATSPTHEEASDSNDLKRPLEKPMASTPVTIQQRRNERDFNYTKVPTPMPIYSEPSSRNLQPLNHSKSLPDKRWTANGTTPSFSLGMPSPAPVTPPSAKLEVRLGVSGNELKNHQHILREPVVMMQRPQSINTKQNQPPSLSTLPSATSGWYSNNITGVENVRSLVPNQSTGSIGLVNQSSEQFYHPAAYKESPNLFNSQLDSVSSGGLGGSWTGMSKPPAHAVPYEPQVSYGAVSASSPSLTAPSSLGLFSGWGSTGTLGSASHVDWNTGVMPEFDYTSIDWTLDSNVSSSSKPNGLWVGLSSLLRNSSGPRMHNSCISGLRDAGVAKETPSSAGLREWTTPFAGKDIFSLPRQFVTYPSP